ncbi:MAG: hypothetical protein NT031_10000, partial [Planctomycetota bacterium]|nr:hypothetical protein [Planctomycetota bacterium]
GENWQVGASHSITWTSQGVSGNVKIEINRNYPSGTWDTLFASVPNDGSESWLVTNPTSPTCRVKVTSLATPSLFDASDSNFTISGPTSTATLYFQPNPKNTGTGAFSWELYLNGATGMKQFEFHLSFDKAYLKKDVPVVNISKLVPVTKENLGDWARQLKAWGFEVSPAYLEMKAPAASAPAEVGK